MLHVLADAGLDIVQIGERLLLHDLVLDVAEKGLPQPKLEGDEGHRTVALRTRDVGGIGGAGEAWLELLRCERGRRRRRRKRKRRPTATPPGTWLGAGGRRYLHPQNNGGTGSRGMNTVHSRMQLLNARDLGSDALPGGGEIPPPPV